MERTVRKIYNQLYYLDINPEVVFFNPMYLVLTACIIKYLIKHSNSKIMKISTHSQQIFYAAKTMWDTPGTDMLGRFRRPPGIGLYGCLPIEQQI